MVARSAVVDSTCSEQVEKSTKWDGKGRGTQHRECETKWDRKISVRLASAIARSQNGEPTVCSTNGQMKQNLT